MRLTFLHRTFVDYTTETPYRREIGGTEAAVAYLTAELAKLGHSVTLLANPSEPGRFLGVECLNHKTALSAALLNAADAVVVCNEACGRKLRDMGVTTPLVLWTQHTDEQHTILDLEFAREREAWSAFVFVSQWQQEEYCSTFWLPFTKSCVMRNAIAPAFAQRAPKQSWFLDGEPAVLAYTSAPYHGLSVLLQAFPLIRSAIAGTRLRVFSGLSTTRGAPDDYRYVEFYNACLGIDGVEYIGPVAQTALAEELSQAAGLVYPSIFAETSCVAAMEAMAVGAMVLTTRYGALPETMAGFGHMVEMRNDPGTLAREFAIMCIDALKAAVKHPTEALLRRDAQVTYMQKFYTWPARAVEWQTWLTSVVTRHHAGAL